MLYTDSAKMEFFESMRFLASEIKARGESLYEMVLNLSKVLDKLKLIKND